MYNDDICALPIHTSTAVNNKKYYLAAIAAYAIWGTFSLVLRPLKEYASLDILFYRIFLCAVVVLAIMLLFRTKVLRENIDIFKALPRQAKNKVLLLNFSGGLLLTANWFCFIYVMNHVSVQVTSLAYLVCPILTTMLAHFILKERLSKVQWVSVWLSVVGCALLSYNHAMDIVYSLLVGSSYAVYLVSQKRNVGFDKFFILTVQVVFSALLLLPFYPAMHEAIPTAVSFYGLITVIAVLFTIVPLLLNLYALKGINSSTSGMLLNINPLLAFTLAFVVFKEPVDITQVVAYGIIAIAVLVFNAAFILGKGK